MNTKNNNFSPRRDNNAPQERQERNARRPALEQRRAAAPMNTAMKDSLAILMRQSMQHASPADRAPWSRTNLGPIPSEHQDGITHVNFGPTAQTQLGQVLSFANPLRFMHPALGVEIPSMQHFWIFLQDGARNLGIFKFTNDKLRAFMRKNGSGKYLPNQYALLAQAYWYKFQEHQLLSELFVDVDALFDYYIIDARGRRRPQSAAHLVDILKYIRATLRNGQRANFVTFLDRDVQLELQDLRGGELAYRVADLLANAVTEHLEIAEEQEQQGKPYHKNQQGKQVKQGTTGYLQAVTGVTTMTELDAEHAQEHDEYLGMAFDPSPCGMALSMSGVNHEHAVTLGVVSEPSTTSMGLTYPEELAAALANTTDLTETVKQVETLKRRVDAGEDIQKVATELGMEITLVTEGVHAPAAPAAPSEPAAPAEPAAPQAPAAPAAPSAPTGEDDGTVIDFGGFKPVMATLTS